MRGKLTDQAALAVALTHAAAAGTPPTVAHLLIGLAAEPEGRAGRRLRERASAAAELLRSAGQVDAPALAPALERARTRAGNRAAGTVDLLDAALAHAGPALATFLVDIGYHRDLDGWLTTDPATEWFEDAETYGFDPRGEAALDPAAARVVAQVRAAGGGAVEVLIAAAAAPDAGMPTPDPRDLAATAARLRSASTAWDAGLEAVLRAAATLRDGGRVGVEDLVHAALIAGGDGPRLIAELTEAKEL